MNGFFAHNRITFHAPECAAKVSRFAVITPALCCRLFPTNCAPAHILEPQMLATIADPENILPLTQLHEIAARRRAIVAELTPDQVHRYSTATFGYLLGVGVVALISAICLAIRRSRLTSPRPLHTRRKSSTLHASIGALYLRRLPLNGLHESLPPPSGHIPPNEYLMLRDRRLSQ